MISYIKKVYRKIKYFFIGLFDKRVKNFKIPAKTVKAKKSNVKTKRTINTKTKRRN